ncbi:hypothetical protein Efla_004316 [Eimeria flavescens]
MQHVSIVAKAHSVRTEVGKPQFDFPTVEYKKLPVVDGESAKIPASQGGNELAVGGPSSANMTEAKPEETEFLEEFCFAILGESRLLKKAIQQHLAPSGVEGSRSAFHEQWNRIKGLDNGSTQPKVFGSIRLGAAALVHTLF